MLLIDELAAVLASSLSRCPPESSADDRARFMSLSVAEHFAGQQVYWPLREVRQACDQARAENGRFVFSPSEPYQNQAERDAKICRDFHLGVDANDLAREHRLSVQTVYLIVRNNAPRSDQMDLFDSLPTAAPTACA